MNVNHDEITFKLSKKRSGFGVEFSDYIPTHVNRLCERAIASRAEHYILFGFGTDMKWALRILQSAGIENIVLADWRCSYMGYDCGGYTVTALPEAVSQNTLIVICGPDVSQLHESMMSLINHPLRKVPAIYELDTPHDPLTQMEPYRTIAERATRRAKSMISDGQLFELVQLVENTAAVEGSIVEFGSLHGGSGAFLVEASQYFSPAKKVYLFDTFEGIPASAYGLDHRWNGSFSNNSFREVCSAFSDVEGVRVVRGDILKTYLEVASDSISLCYLASDTLESGRLVVEKIWPMLSQGGVLVICDYGSYPNCLPLTALVNDFLKFHKPGFVYRNPNIGIFLTKA
jgi:O-methyltransferase